MDEEGDLVVQHAFLSDSEKRAILFEFSLRSIEATIYDTSPYPAVSSEDELAGSR